MSSSSALSSPLARAIASEEGVYGLILVTGLIASAGSTGAHSGKTLILTGVTVVVFWLAHVYAGTVAAHGSTGTDGSPLSLRASASRAVRRSRGLLASTLPPAVPLILGALRLIPHDVAIWTALWVGVAALAVLGFLSYTRKGASLHRRILGALSAASFGVVIILAKVLVTH